MGNQNTEVFVQIAGKDVLAGRIWSRYRRGTESATFTYDESYLSRGPDAYAIDPALPLVTGQQQTPLDKKTFGAFSDCAPDRWGRRLITRAEKQQAQKRGIAERSFSEMDYVLGVRDDLRQGALRFRDPIARLFLAQENIGIPYLIELPKLLNAAERLERDEATENELRDLLRAGSSLGGARPKAHVLDASGKVAIAKFPSVKNDDWDVMRWEAVALELARAAGICVPDFKLHSIDNKSVLILDRFDRAQGLRIGYVSAMTMLEATDRDKEQRSYMEIAETITLHSPQASQDLRELWRRIAFSVLISNTDDHLRNHGFLRASSAGWSLSPAFDLNPNPMPGPRLCTAIDLYDTSLSIDTLIEVTEEFRLSDDDVRQILSEVSSAVNSWRTVAEKLGLDRPAIEDMAPAFEHDRTERAREVIDTGVVR